MFKTSPPIPVHQRVAPDIFTLADHERSAQRQLDANAWAYFSGGAGDEITLRANRSAWDGLTLQPRVLRSLSGATTQGR